MIKKILVSQPQPTSDKSPYYDIARDFGVELVFRPFIKVEGLSSKEFRQQKISLLDFTAVVFTSRHAIDNYFKLAKEMRVNIPEDMKYFCVTETISLYIQKYVQYRKRKVFYGNTGKIDDVVPLMVKHKSEKFLVPLSSVHNDAMTKLLDAKKLNEAASAAGLRENYGHQLGKTLCSPLGHGIMGDSIFSRILSATSCACDARMAGAMVPVMSNSGSGNQGICTTMPVVVFAKENHNTEEELIRALVMSNLTAIYIKQNLGTLSALCGCVVASTGSSCGITYLMGGNFEQICFSVKNMIANLTGMSCDGAKPSCALKLTSGVSTAVLSAMLAMQHKYVTSYEGIIDDDVDQSIRNLTAIGSRGMNDTDRFVLDIMTHKGVKED